MRKTATAPQATTGVRIQKVRLKRDTPRTVELICDRELGLAGSIRLGLIPRLDALGPLADTELGEALLRLADGETSGNMYIADEKYGRNVRGRITIEPPWNSSATLFDLLDDILRLAGRPESLVAPEDTKAVLAEIKRALNLYLERTEGHPADPAAHGTGTSPGVQRSLLWAYFDRPLVRRNDVILTAEDILNRRSGTMRQLMPWLDESIDI